VVILLQGREGTREETWLRMAWNYKFEGRKVRGKNMRRKKEGYETGTGIKLPIRKTGRISLFLFHFLCKSRIMEREILK